MSAALIIDEGLKSLLPPLRPDELVALERLCDGLTRGGTPAVVLIATHGASGDIDCAAASVVQIREGGRWREALRPVSLRSAIEHYRAQAGVLL